MPKKISAKRQKELDELLKSIREAKKDPHFRKAAREFIEYHTGTGRYSE